MKNKARIEALERRVAALEQEVSWPTVTPAQSIIENANVGRCPASHPQTGRLCIFHANHDGWHRGEWEPGEARPEGYGDYVLWDNDNTSTFGHIAQACHTTNADFERYTRPRPNGWTETGYRCRRCGWTTS